MVQESCNLDKDEAEIMKPSSSSSPAPSPAPPPPTPAPPALSLKPPQEIPSQRHDRPEACAAPKTAVPAAPKPEKEPRPPVRFGSRCSSCQKKVGLTGFRCRCGDLFCARHRYSDTHYCSFDYKAAGREEISKANPAIRAAKIIRI